MTLRNTTLDAGVFAAFADTVASRNLVWFIGSGFSLPEMPSATALARVVIGNAFGQSDAPYDETFRVHRWETIKHILLGRGYSRYGLRPCSMFADIQADLAVIDEALADERPWVWQILHLGRVTDIMFRTAPEGQSPAIELASLMDLSRDALWKKEPGLAHHLLALLMLEGMVLKVITTNYDTLVEDAFSEASGNFLHCIRTAAEFSHLASCPWDMKPTVYKIHGCRSMYAKAVERGGDDLETAASAIVITDRQLQHWRDERWNWARDVLATSLRQHPFLFIGFSGADAVLQATLNSIAEEPRGNPPPVYLCMELTFPLFQFLSQYPGFDPLNPQNLLPVRGEALMMDLYPAAITRFFINQARTSRTIEHLTWEIACSMFHCPSKELLDIAVDKAISFLGDWVSEVSNHLVDQVPGSSPRRLYVSPGQLLLSEFNLCGGYRPLTEYASDYDKLVGLFSLAIAQRFGDESTIRSLQAYVKSTRDHSTLVIHSRESTPVCFALVPSRLFKQAEGLQTWLQLFFESRQLQGIDYEPEVVFLYAGDLSREELRTVWSRVSSLNRYTPKPVFWIWSCSGYFNSEEVYPGAPTFVQ